MGKVVKLSVHKNTKQKKKNRECYERLVNVAKAMPKDSEGWVLVVFRRNTDENGQPVIDTVTEYTVKDPMDIYNLPNLAQTKIIQKLSESHYNAPEV